MDCGESVFDKLLYVILMMVFAGNQFPKMSIQLLAKTLPEITIFSGGKVPVCAVGKP